MRDVKLSDLIAPVYKDFFRDWSTRTWILSGGRMSAKGDTVYTKCAWEMSQRPLQVNVYVPLDNLIVDGVQPQVTNVLKRMGIPHTSKRKRIILANGSQFVFKGMAFENKQRKAEAFKGLTSELPLLAVVFDELASLDEPSRMFTIMDTHSRQNPQFICVFNPPRNRSSWLISWRDTAPQKDPNIKALHTTVYDLEPTGWEFLKQAYEEAESRRLISEVDWQHNYLGLPVGGDGVAFDVNTDSLLIDMETVKATHYKGFMVFGDIGNADATTHLLFGVRDGGLDLLRTSYYDGRQEEYLPHSLQCDNYQDWLDEAGIYPSEEYFDNLNFTLEVKARRPRKAKVYSIKEKKRHEIYDVGRQALASGFIRVLNIPDNQIVLEQIKNANVEEVSRQGKDVLVIKKVDNRITPIERQIHSLDALLYAIYYKYKRLTYM